MRIRHNFTLAGRLSKSRNITRCLSPLFSITVFVPSGCQSHTHTHKHQHAHMHVHTCLHTRLQGPNRLFLFTDSVQMEWVYYTHTERHTQDLREQFMQVDIFSEWQLFLCFFLLFVLAFTHGLDAQLLDSCELTLAPLDTSLSFLFFCDFIGHGTLHCLSSCLLSLSKDSGNAMFCSEGFDLECKYPTYCS